jgi:hypothetical protein
MRGYMDKVKVFEKELIYIKNDDIRRFTEKAIESLPDYFFTVPSSSSGKYHPQYALGEGGLLRHVRACVRVAVELFRMHMFYNYFTSDELDIIIASLILHDGWKQGDGSGSHTVTEHPIVASFAIKDNSELNGIISDEYRDMICGNVSHHMGFWTKDSKTKQEVLEPPEGKMQNLVHLIDYICSRRCLEMNFDVPIERE